MNTMLLLLFIYFLGILHSGAFVGCSSIITRVRQHHPVMHDLPNVIFTICVSSICIRLFERFISKADVWPEIEPINLITDGLLTNSS